MIRRLFTSSAVCFVLAGISLPARAGRITVSRQPEKKRVEFGNGTLRDIRYGRDESAISENWVFRVTESDIRREIERTVARPFKAEDVAFPGVTFNRL